MSHGGRAKFLPILGRSHGAGSRPRVIPGSICDYDFCFLIVRAGGITNSTVSPALLQRFGFFFHRAKFLKLMLASFRKLLPGFGHLLELLSMSDRRSPWPCLCIRQRGEDIPQLFSQMTTSAHFERRCRQRGQK
jgi:hypothetical protein